MKEIWLKQAAERRSALGKGIENHESNDVLVPYPEIALAFPSNEPNPYSFDYPSIDQQSLLVWAEQNNLEARKAPEKTPEGEMNPPIRFIKKNT